MMFLGYGAFARIYADNDKLIPCPFSGKQLKLPTALPSAPKTASEGYCSASWMFAFASIFDASDSEIAGALKSTTLDLSG